MKSFIKPITLFVFIISGIVSCHEPIDIDVPDTQKKIVLNGLINPDSTVRVNLSKSISILDKDDDIEFLTTADVKLYEDDVYKETLQYDTNGYYRGTLYPQENHDYKITATSPPLDAVNAETIILPKPAEFSFNSQTEFSNEVQTWYNENTGEPYDTTIYTLYHLNVQVTINDPENKSNAYFLTFTAVMPSYVYNPPDYNPVFIGNKMTSLDYNTENLDWEDQFYSSELNGYVISDNLFNGSTYTINANVYTYSMSGIGDQVDTVYINLHSVTDDFYQYVLSYSNYENADGNPLAEPVNIFSNIHNGYGFFSGYSTRQDTIVIDYQNKK